MNKATFLDRDGVINRKAPEGRYVTRWEAMHFLPGVASAIAMLNKAGFRVIVVSNQRCVAKGLVTAADVDAIHQRMCNELAAAGAVIDAVYYCPHEKSPPCICRKPAPGMLLSAAYEHQIDLGVSWMVGDSDIDVAAGKNAGCKTVLLEGNNKASDASADLVAQSLLEATWKILQSEGLSHFGGRAATVERN